MIHVQLCQQSYNGVYMVYITRNFTESTRNPRRFFAEIVNFRKVSCAIYLIRTYVRIYVCESRNPILVSQRTILHIRIMYFLLLFLDVTAHLHLLNVLLFKIVCMYVRTYVACGQLFSALFTSLIILSLELKQAEKFWKSCHSSFTRALEHFTSVDDQVHIAVVHCNLSRLFRLCATAYGVPSGGDGGRQPVSPPEQQCYQQAVDHLLLGLSALGRKGSSQELRTDIKFELSSVYFTMGLLMQDFAPSANSNDKEVWCVRCVYTCVCILYINVCVAYTATSAFSSPFLLRCRWANKWWVPSRAPSTTLTHCSKPSLLTTPKGLLY